jgi:hypothetical protein
MGGDADKVANKSDRTKCKLTRLIYIKNEAVSKLKSKQSALDNFQWN